MPALREQRSRKPCSGFLFDLIKRERAAKFNVEKIKPQDLAGAAGPPDEET